jgi:hypothetical protein
MLLGSGGGDECTAAINYYFSIVAYHNGHVDLSGTPKARLNYLEECSSNDGWAQKINAAYGGVIK